MIRQDEGQSWKDCAARKGGCEFKSHRYRIKWLSITSRYERVESLIGYMQVQLLSESPQQIE